MNDHERDEQTTYREFTRDTLNAILAQVTATNGRLRKAEVAIAVLQWGYALGAAIAAGFVGAVIVAFVSGVFKK